MIPKSRQLATAVQLQPVQSGPVSSLFAVLWTGLLNSIGTCPVVYCVLNPAPRGSLFELSLGILLIA